MLFLCQKLLKNRNCLNILMFLQGAMDPDAAAAADTRCVHTVK